MKLRNILIASMALFAFASCSKDDGNVPEKPMELADAYLTIRASSNILTKAVTGEGAGTDKGIANEKFVNTLNVYLFKSTGELVYYKHVDAVKDNKGESISQVDSILVKVTPTRDYASSEEEFKLVLLANVKDQSVANLTGLNNLSSLINGTILDYKVAGTGSDNSDKGSYLPMKSGELLIKGLRANQSDKKVTNWIGKDGTVYPSETDGQEIDKKVELTRMVARIQIEKISLNLQDRYPGASFKISTISLVNIRPSINMNGGTGDFIKGYQSGNFGVADKVIVPGNENGSNIKPYYAVEFPKADYQYHGASVIDEDFIDPLKEGKPRTFCRYVFPNAENSEYDTAILLSGYFRASDKLPGELKQYLVPLVKDGVKSVLANSIYRISVVINGEGSKNEDKPEQTASIAVTLTVEPWNLVNQYEEDEK